MKCRLLNITGLKANVEQMGRENCDTGPLVYEIRVSECSSVQPCKMIIRGSFMRYRESIS